MIAPGWPHGRDARDIDRLAKAAETGWGTAAFVGQLYPAALADPRACEFLATMQRHGCGPATAVRFIRLLHEYDVREILPALRLPVLTLALRGADDDWLYRQAEATTALIPGAVLHPLPVQATRLWHPSVIEATRAFAGIHRPARGWTRCWPRCCSPTSSARPSGRPRSATIAWKDLVERHHALVRGALAQWRGVENDTAGDGFYATFDGPARAIRCALEIGDRVATSASRSGPGSTPASAS